MPRSSGAERGAGTRDAIGARGDQFVAFVADAAAALPDP
jgi:hypothetical protein